MISNINDLFVKINNTNLYNNRLLVLIASECLLKLKNNLDFDVFESKNQNFINCIIEKLLLNFPHLNKYTQNIMKLSFKYRLETRKRYVDLVLQKSILNNDVICVILSFID